MTQTQIAALKQVIISFYLPVSLTLLRYKMHPYPPLFFVFFLPSFSATSPPNLLLRSLSPVLWEPLRKSFSVVPPEVLASLLLQLCGAFPQSDLKESLHSQKSTSGFLCRSFKHAKVICVYSALCALQP